MKETEASSTRKVDQSELRVHQGLVISVLVAAFIVNRWELVAFQAGVFILTVLNLSLGPYIALYRHVLRPAGIVKPDIRADNPEAHRFALMLGTVVVSSATYLLATGNSVAGWGLVWLLISLASVGFAGWCAGCFTYYMMNRLGLRGVFKYAAIKGTFPGVRPPKAR